MCTYLRSTPALSASHSPLNRNRYICTEHSTVYSRPWHTVVVSRGHYPTSNPQHSMPTVYRLQYCVVIMCIGADPPRTAAHAKRCMYVRSTEYGVTTVTTVLLQLRSYRSQVWSEAPLRQEMRSQRRRPPDWAQRIGGKAFGRADWLVRRRCPSNQVEGLGPTLFHRPAKYRHHRGGNSVLHTPSRVKYAVRSL